jgi:hypothetical protein
MKFHEFKRSNEVRKVTTTVFSTAAVFKVPDTDWLPESPLSTLGVSGFQVSPAGVHRPEMCLHPQFQPSVNLFGGLRVKVIEA